MLARLQQYFVRLTLREKVLLSLFLWVILLIALNAVIGEVRFTLVGVRGNQETLAAYEPVVAHADQVEAQLQQVRAQFDSERTLSRADLAGRVDQLSNRAGLELQSLRTDTTPVGLLKEHTARVRYENVPIADLLRLSQLVRQDNPYLYLARVRLTDEQRSPQLLDVPLIEINSFELELDLEPNLDDAP
ncbi:MAG: hypothetical protein ACFB21_15600 [Opitutales bacterium]